MGLILNIPVYDLSGDFVTYTPNKTSIATVIQRKAAVRQVSLSRLTASHFPPASKLAGIQWSFL